MDRAAELAVSGAPSGTVVVADFQSAGRGTGGRAWQAPAGSCLMFTLLARPRMAPVSLQALPARVSASIAAILSGEFCLACAIKPPNDILIQERKVCGVLCTSRVVSERVEWVLCGIGLNTFMAWEALPTSMATSLLVEGVTPPEHDELLRLLLHGLEWLRDA
jgi:BirA family biotin operon repressor/biotin-[acetyl-CoA-carboxylase] ligase